MTLEYLDRHGNDPDLRGPPTVRKVVAALLRVEERLSQTAFAEAAGVPTQSIRNNRDVLEALDLVAESAALAVLGLDLRIERRGESV